MFLKPKKNRRYSYAPRVYKPEEERQKAGLKRRTVKFHRGSGVKKRWRSTILIVVAIVVIIYVLNLLSRFALS